MIKLGSNNIGKIYLGSNPIGKAYYGSDIVFQKGGQPVQLIPYIRGGDDGSYINTGITPDNTTRVIVWARNINPHPSQSGWVIGSRVAYEDSAFGFVTIPGSHVGQIRVTYGSTTLDNSCWEGLLHYHKYELGPEGFFVDDTLVSAVSGNSANQFPLYIFGMNNGGTLISQSPNPFDLIACKIYKNNTLVRDFTAVNSPSVGLYDAVSGTVFTNAGSGSFTYGSFNPNAYTPLEYITANGSSYFMTDVIGNYSLLCVTKFKPTGTSKSYFDIFGVRDSTNRCQFFVGNDSYSCSRLSANLGTSVSTSDFYSSNTAGYVRGNEFVGIKNNNSFSAYYNNAQVGSTYTSSANSSFTTNGNVCVCASYYTHTQEYVHGFVGNLYYMLLNTRNYVPAKVGNVAGMYDTYNDVFYGSITSTPFTAGPEL